MDDLRQYVISVVTAALICGILSGLFENGTWKTLIRLLCSLFLAFTVIRPVTDIDFTALTEYALPYSAEADNAAAAGEIMASEAVQDIIKAETEAYILDKAAGMNAKITVDVTTNGDGIPTGAALSGKISPYAKARLAEILESDLGITKENQVWTG